ncbi:thioredoxin domain-containing protein [bacterium]|nr:thioredoxin domain-containing protein [bacterium]
MNRFTSTAILPARLLAAIALLACLALSACPGSGDGNTGDGSEADPPIENTGQQGAEAGGSKNHLQGETSLYLQQHVQNPVDWYPWKDEALQRAISENKLIFLSVGYSSCHWCHVMEEEVFEDQEIADYLNEHFVCIKVDREERPDIDATYQPALVGLAGESGWPLNMFLTPALKPVTGSTYRPKAEFMALTERVVQVWEENREELLNQSDMVASFVATLPETGPAGEIDQALLDEIVDTAVPLFDETWGGFVSPQKFPTPVRWQFLMHYYRKTGDEDARRMLVKTLDEMMRGGLYDHIGGGFHRYVVDDSWTVPHFEKLLYDNAQLASLYIEAGELFDNDDYRFIAKDTLDFMLREMRDEQGGFYSSFDADSGGVEGSFYCFTPSEMIEIAGETDGVALNSMFGITEEGNFADFHGKIANVTVLSRRAKPEKVMEASGLSREEVDALFDKYRQQIRDYRAKRVAPTLDRKIVTSWNGLTLSAFAQAYAAYGDEQYLQAAEGIRDYIASAHVQGQPGGAFHRASTGHEPVGDALLDDYANLANGLFDLYVASGDSAALQLGSEALSFANEHFRAEDAVWYMTPDFVEQPLGRRIEIYDTVEPCGISQMLKGLLREAALTGNTEYFATVESDLAAYHSQIGNFVDDPQSGNRYANGLEMANWLDAALLSNGPFYEVVIAGDPADPATQELLSLARSGGRSFVLTMHVPAAGPDEQMLALQPVLQGKAQWEEKPTAFVCRKGSCNAPTNDATEMQSQLSAGWAH